MSSGRLSCLYHIVIAISKAYKRLSSLYSNTPFNLHLSSINFDTHIHSWSLYNIAPVSYSLYPLFSLNKNISLFWRRMNLENCQKYINLLYNIQNILNVSGNNHTKCQIALNKKWCKTLHKVVCFYFIVSKFKSCIDK